MKILVQNRRTNAFLMGETQWVKQMDHARTFPTSLEALRFCVNRQLEDMDLLVCFNGRRNDLRLPLC